MNYSQTLKQYKFNINLSYKSKLKTKMATLMFSLFFVNNRSLIIIEYLFKIQYKPWTNQESRNSQDPDPDFFGSNPSLLFNWLLFNRYIIIDQELMLYNLYPDDISVVFYEEKSNKVVWEAQADFSPTQVHKQVAIAFRTPKYRSIQVTDFYLTRSLR